MKLVDTTNVELVGGFCDKFLSWIVSVTGYIINTFPSAEYLLGRTIYILHLQVKRFNNDHAILLFHHNY